MEADADAEDGDPAVLSSSTLAILNSFLEEQKKAREESSKDPFAEDWGMSQVNALYSVCIGCVFLGFRLISLMIRQKSELVLHVQKHFQDAEHSQADTVLIAVWQPQPPIL